MQLTTEQVQSLFSFTEKKMLHWYDLQLEMVDHLASRIEEAMELDKSLNFESALSKVYKGFGLFGFAKVVQEKQTQLQRAARKMWWEEVITYFSWPKIILLILFAFVLWQLSLKVEPNLLMKIFMGIYIFISIVFLIYVFKTSRMRCKLLLMQFGRSHQSLVVFIYEIFIVFGFNHFSKIEFCVYASFGILFKLASFQLYNKVKEKASLLYPKAFLPT